MHTININWVHKFKFTVKLILRISFQIWAGELLYIRVLYIELPFWKAYSLKISVDLNLFYDGS